MSAQPDADRYSDVRLNLTCPRCGATGLVPLEQLDQALFCFGCQQRFRVERQGLVALPNDRVNVQVRTHLSEWEGHEAILTSRWSLAGGRLLERLTGFLTRGWARWAALAATLVAASVWIALASRAPEETPPLEIPTTLDARAEMFTQALARREIQIVTRLTDPSQHRALRIWLAHGTDVPPQTDGEPTDLGVKVVGTLATPAGDQMAVRVQLSRDGKTVVLNQQWAQRGDGAWYFQPVRLRSTNNLKAPAVPYTKQRRRG